MAASRWLERPQQVALRKVLFQIHLWTGIGVGLYVFVIGVSGSVLVYRNEFYNFFSPRPTIVVGTGAPMTLDDLKRTAIQSYPGYEIADARIGETPNQAVEIVLRQGTKTKRRLFHPFTGEDLGNPVPAGYRFTSWLLDLHDNLLSGPTGRRVNGVGALCVTVLSVTGAVIWWPGARRWRHSLTLDRRAGWRRLNWSLHSFLGFWCFAFILLWGVTGLYLAFPQFFASAFDAVQPFDEANPAERTVDTIQYWLAYLHFGRLGGRGIPGCGRGLCDSITKAVWAAFGLVPPAMFVTGALMWWSRVLRPMVRRGTRDFARQR